MQRVGTTAMAGWGIVLGALTTAAPAVALDAERAAAALREALEVGAERAIVRLGAVDGYLGDPEVHIDVPDKLRPVERAIDAIGLDALVDDFEESLNRAAEAAVPAAREVVVEAVKQIGFEDAIAIVRGDGHEATDYLEAEAGPRIGELFRPIVAERLDAVGATRAYQALADRVARVPLVRMPELDLAGYVTDRAIDGLFVALAQEEQKIRDEPLARTTDLLKDVFGAVTSGGGDDAEDDRPWWRRILG